MHKMPNTQPQSHKFKSTQTQVVVPDTESTGGRWIVHFKVVNFMLCEFRLNKIF